jgi:periplasmic divalent cation tolerance protein
MLIVFTTTPDKEEAETLARKLVEEKLAGCVQIVPRITSFYSWENKVQKDEEYLLLIKTLPEIFTELEVFIKENHSYSVPEIAAIEVGKVSANYLSWLNDVTAK